MYAVSTRVRWCQAMDGGQKWKRVVLGRHPVVSSTSQSESETWFGHTPERTLSEGTHWERAAVFVDADSVPFPIT